MTRRLLLSQAKPLSATCFARSRLQPSLFRSPSLVPALPASSPSSAPSRPKTSHLAPLPFPALCCAQSSLVGPPRLPLPREPGGGGEEEEEVITASECPQCKVMATKPLQVPLWLPLLLLDAVASLVDALQSSAADFSCGRSSTPSTAPGAAFPISVVAAACLVAADRFFLYSKILYVNTIFNVSHENNNFSMAVECVSEEQTVISYLMAIDFDDDVNLAKKLVRHEAGAAKWMIARIAGPQRATTNRGEESTPTTKS
ncbi:hypothetical protein GW17_00037654 [Ensete ventricosum]|nr:hypothetical protein GW17_00037654 [Ensete ventricosum]